MKRDRPGPNRSRPDHARGHPGRSETNRTGYESNCDGACKRVPGALTRRASDTGVPLGSIPIAAAEVIGETHCTGLNVVWTVLCDHRRPPPAR
jgi:hypothetical protein